VKKKVGCGRKNLNAPEMFSGEGWKEMQDLQMQNGWRCILIVLLAKGEANG